VALTESGETAAAELVRHQRLLELFLFRILGMPLDQVATEAEQLEHVLSEALEERIDALLEHPREDPHGDPIPDLQGRVRIAPAVRLSEVPVGQVVQVQRLLSQDAGLMHYLESLGLVPGAMVCMESRTAYGDVFILRMGEVSLPVGAGIAAQVQVRILHESKS
jgi:DtxR family Mn-dependent transcriptional regulator